MMWALGLITLLLIESVPASPSSFFGEAPFLLPLPTASDGGLGVLAEVNIRGGAESGYACLLLPARSASLAADGASSEARGPKQDTDKDAALAKSLLSVLTGNCSTLPIDRPGGYAYKVCIGQSVHQQAADGSDFLLGNYDGGASTVGDASAAFAFEPNVQRYINGNPCPGTARSARVAFFCGDSFGVLSAAEPQMCGYEVAVAHPLLCTAPRSVFPRANAPPPVAPPGSQRHGGGSDGSQSGVGNGGAVNPAAAALWSRLGAVARAFPRLRSALTSRGLGSAALRGGAADAATAAGDAADAAAAAAASGGMADAAGGMADVAGVGGASIGLDDRFRSSVHWTGMPSGGSGSGGGSGAGGSRAAPVSWALQAVAFTATGDDEQHVGGAVAGSGAGSPSRSSRVAGAAAQAGSANGRGDVAQRHGRHDDVEGASCTAYLTDDLRRQGERSGAGAAVGAAGIGATQIVLVRLQPKKATGAASAAFSGGSAVPQLSGATAVVRGTNRALLASLASDGRSSEPVVHASAASTASAAWELAVWSPAAPAPASAASSGDECTRGADGLGLPAAAGGGASDWCAAAQRLLCGGGGSDSECSVTPIAVARRAQAEAAASAAAAGSAESAGSAGPAVLAQDVEEFVSLQAQFIVSAPSS